MRPSRCPSVYGLDLISATDGGGDQTYLLYDGLGSTTGLTDDEGDVVDDYTYDVFGAIRSQSGSSDNYWLFTGELSIFTTAEASYTCVRLESEGYCSVNEGGEGDNLFGQALSMDPRSFVSLARQFGNADVEVNGDRIADRDATCFTASNLHDMADETTLCFAADGSLLLWSEVNDGQTFEFRATRITSDVSDADFELPYEIKEPTFEDILPTP